MIPHVLAAGLLAAYIGTRIWRLFTTRITVGSPTITALSHRPADVHRHCDVCAAPPFNDDAFRLWLRVHGVHDEEHQP